MSALTGKTIVVTRARHQAGEFVRLIEKRGGRAVAIPTIEIVEPETWKPVDEAIDGIARYQWLILTSANGADYFLRRFRSRRGSCDALRGLRICAVGPKTRASIEKEGLEVAFMPSEHVAEAVVEQGGAETWRGARVLFARAAEGREVIPEGLEGMGARVDVVAVYRNVPPPLSAKRFREVLAGGGADAITFTSGSTVQNFASRFPGGEAARLLAGTAVGCIGPVTADTARSLGLEVTVVPEEYTIPAFIEALELYFERGQ